MTGPAGRSPGRRVVQPPDVGRVAVPAALRAVADRSNGEPPQSRRPHAPPMGLGGVAAEPSGRGPVRKLPGTGGEPPRRDEQDGDPEAPPTPVTVGDLLRRRQMWGFVATTACVEFCRGALFLSLLPAYLPQRMGLSVAGVGLVISGQYLSDTVFKIPAGWLVDRIGPWRVLLPFMSICALAVYLLPHVRTLVPFLLLGVLFGFGTSANWPAVLSGSVHLSGLSSRASATSITFLAWLAGGGIGPVLINFLVDRNFSLPFIVLSVVITGAPLAAVLGITGVLRNAQDPPWHPAGDDPAETVGALLSNLRSARWLIPGMFVQMFALGMLVPVLVPFSRQVLHLSAPQYGLMLLAGGSVTVLCLMPMGRVVDRFGSKTPLVAGFAMAAVAVLLVAHGTAEADLLWRVSLLGLSYALILPAWNGLTVGKIAEGQRGLLLGVFMAIEGVGVAVGPMIGGRLFTIGYRLPFQATAAVLAAIAVFYLVVPTRQFEARAQDGHAAP